MFPTRYISAGSKKINTVWFQIPICEMQEPCAGIHSFTDCWKHSFKVWVFSLTQSICQAFYKALHCKDKPAVLRKPFQLMNVCVHVYTHWLAGWLAGFNVEPRKILSQAGEIALWLRENTALSGTPTSIFSTQMIAYSCLYSSSRILSICLSVSSHTQIKDPTPLNCLQCLCPL